MALLLLQLATPTAGGAAPPKVVDGAIDLRNWNFTSDGPVALDGQWTFFWHRFLQPQTPIAAGMPEATLAVPYVWNGQRIGGETIGGNGYATYRLRLQLPAQTPPLGLHIIDAATACTFYADGKTIYTAGIPAATREHSVPEFKPSVVALPATDGDVDLVVHISNYYHRQGGLWDRITIGEYSELLAMRERRIVFNMVLFGSLLLMGFYHLGLFGMRRVDLSPLYFGLGCIAVLLRTVSTGERYIVQIFPAFPFELLSKLEYWGFYLSIGCFSLFIGTLFPRESDRRIIVGFTLLSALFSLLVLLTPLRIYSFSTPLFEIITLLALAYGVIILIRALINNSAGAGIFLAGFIFFAATAVNDILYSRQFIHTFYMVQFGLLIFILAQALLLSRRMSELFVTVETQQAVILASEKKYRMLVDNANEAIFIVQDGRFAFVNPLTEALFGYDANALSALPFISCVHPDDRADVTQHLNSGIEEHAEARTRTFRLIQRSGKILWVQLNAVATQWDGKPAVLNLLSDINQRKQLENRLYRAQKMEALGTLAKGIAQDFDRFISHMMRETEGMMTEWATGSDRSRHFQKMVDACSNARQLASSVLAFSRRDAGDMRPLRIAAAIENTIQLLQLTFSPQVALRTDISARETMVKANANQVSEILLELATNAVDAMKTGSGSLYIALHEVALPQGTTATGGSLPPGNYARLTVVDNGSGISEEIAERVFDPYFTTKPAGEGTGMGLAAVMGIVKNHKGDIDLISTPGIGTTIHVYLPTMDTAAANGDASKRLRFL
ncbi:MAG: 7TM diverse intracellular signaling domain-containing protein [Pseudomonadota bacterium]